MTSMPWGPPKPRNAVFDALCVLAMRPFTRMLGIQYALSMWHSARDRTGSERSRLQPPSAVKVASRATMRPLVVEPDPPVGVEPMALARHGQVLRAVQPDPDRAPGEHRAQGGDRRKPVRLHLLAAEAAAHAQALHRDVVVVPAQHVRHDLLGLGRVLGAALDEDLLALVDVGQCAMGLEVEVLLAGELELAAEDVDGGGEAGLDVAPPQLCGSRPGTTRPRSPRSPSRTRGAARCRPRPPPRRAGRPRGVSPSTQHTAWP